MRAAPLSGLQTLQVARVSGAHPGPGGAPPGDRFALASHRPRMRPPALSGLHMARVSGAHPGQACMKLSGVGWPRKRPSALSGLRVTGYGLLQRRILRQRPCVLYEDQQQLARLFGQDLVRGMLEPLEVLVGSVDAVEPFAGDVRVDAAVVAAGEDDQ